MSFYGRGRGGGGKRRKFENPSKNQGQSSSSDGAHQSGQSGSLKDLYNTLHRIDGRQYPAYKDMNRSYQFEKYTLYIDHIQSDPFASPSRLRVRVQEKDANFPAEAWSEKIRNIALCDFLTRVFASESKRMGADVRQGSGNWHGGKGGDINIECPGQHVLERTSVVVTKEYVEARILVGLPAQGRRIMGYWAEEILTDTLPKLVTSSLFCENIDAEKMWQHIKSVEDQETLRRGIPESKLIAFVRDGAILPRESGVSDLPMADKVVPFESPENMRVSFDLPNCGKISGMGIKEGVTLIVGGGFHGKSTLLHALEFGIYNHIPGDGREFVCSVENSVKIRAEDGRSISGVNISPFINNLPFQKDTTKFCTSDASGSTSQAANVMEALEVGTSCLLVDEDTCATNFMIRDQWMKMLVPSEKEPITPFISKIRTMYEHQKVSSILVIGGAGSFFDVADCVIMMDCYKPRDVTEKAKKISVLCWSSLSQFRVDPKQEDTKEEIVEVRHRAPIASSVNYMLNNSKTKIKCYSPHEISFGESAIDLSGVSQIAERSQTNAIADALRYLKDKYMDGRLTIREMLQKLDDDFNREGLNVLTANAGNFSRPRSSEVAAALNRLRTFKTN